MTVRRTSRDCYHELEANGRLSEQQEKLMRFLNDQPKGFRMSRREIAEKSGIPINALPCHVQKLIKKGWLDDSETGIDPVTNKTVHLVRIKTYPEQLELVAA